MTSRAKSAARYRRTSSRKASSRNLFGGFAVACLVLGSSYAVYSNILAASVYPTLGESSFDQPVLKPRSEPVATRSAAQAISDVFAALPAEPAPVIRKPMTQMAAVSPSMMFSDRFAASAADGVSSRAAEAAPPPPVASKPAETPKLADAPKRREPAPQQVALNLAPPPPRADEAKAAKPAATSFGEMAQRAKAAMMSLTSGDRKSVSDKLWGKQPSLLSYASADATASIAQDQNPAQGGAAPYDRSTAVYDISAKMVYLPDGTTLEAHSGLGEKLDDPNSARVRMLGVTPPHIYELKPREALFHGVPALRLTPVGGEDAIYGRTGLLAHTYMLGPNGDSNGCVSFKDYHAFLDAYKNKGIRKLAVVTRIE
jgi:type VI secretion system (T6SS) effector TldE1-like protein